MATTETIPSDEVGKGGTRGAGDGCAWGASVGLVDVDGVSVGQLDDKQFVD